MTHLALRPAPAVRAAMASTEAQALERKEAVCAPAQEMLGVAFGRVLVM